ncbi:MAG TPA: ABC transporter permease subunit [Candidatus Limnocylindria bacterium]|nr:ABC transporter permease subunit [Candidatus Limnocylindria bacterium]
MTATAAQPMPRRPSAAREFLSTVATVMAMEVRGRFRRRRAFVVLTLYLAVLALIAYGAYAVEAPRAREAAELGSFFDTIGTPNASARVGQAIFTVLSLFQLLLVCFIAPAFTAGAISLEREKLTLDMLVVTPMRPGGLVVGKLLSALAFVILMLLAGIPISALVLMYGGVSADDVVRQQVVLFVAAISCGVIGLFWSTLLKRTQTATVLTYTTLIVLTIGSLLVWRFWSASATYSGENTFGEVRTAPEALLYANPAVAMIEILANTELDYGDFSEILDQLRGSGGSVICEGDVCFPTEPRDGVNAVPGGGAAEEDVFSRPPVKADFDLLAVPPVTADDELVSNHFWPRITITLAGLSLILTLVSMRLVVPAGMRWRVRRRSNPDQPGDPSPIIEEPAP